MISYLFSLFLCAGATSASETVRYSTLLRRLEASKQAGDYYQYIDVLIGLSRDYLTRGEVKNAQSYGEKALKGAALLMSNSRQCTACTNLGNIKAFQGFYGEAIQSYKKALMFCSDYVEDKLLILANICNCAARQENRHLLQEKSRELGLELINNRTLKRDRSTLRLMVESAGYAEQAGHDKLAKTLLRHVLTTAERRKAYAVFADATVALSELFLVEDRCSEAELLVRKAIFYAAKSPEMMPLYRLYRMLGKSLVKQGRHSEGLREYRKAVDFAAKVRPSLNEKAASDKAFWEITAIYYELTELIIKNLENLDEHSRQKELKQLCLLMERLKISELKNYFHDDCVIEVRNRERSLEEVAGQDTALVYTISMDQQLAVILYTAGKYRLAMSDIPVFKLHQDVMKLRNLCQINSENVRTAAGAIYRKILKPFEKELLSVDHLVFIPDSPLQQLPWGVLFDGEQFLVEKFSTSVSLGMSLNSPQKLDLAEVDILVAGLTDELPSVGQELKAVQDCFPASMVVNEELTRDRLAFELRNHFYRIIHLATHADFTEGSEQNYLMTGAGRMNIKELEEWIKMSALRENGIELLTLSACKTAVGDEFYNMGLAGTAIRSGAKSVLASFWEVDDKATALLMAAFYQNLKNGDSRAAALQKAQLSLLRNATYSSPYYWASFSLIGSWL